VILLCKLLVTTPRRQSWTRGRHPTARPCRTNISGLLGHRALTKGNHLFPEFLLVAACEREPLLVHAARRRDHTILVLLHREQDPAVVRHARELASRPRCSGGFPQHYDVLDGTCRLRGTSFRRLLLLGTLLLAGLGIVEHRADVVSCLVLPPPPPPARASPSGSQCCSQ